MYLNFFKKLDIMSISVITSHISSRTNIRTFQN